MPVPQVLEELVAMPVIVQKEGSGGFCCGEILLHGENARSTESSLDFVFFFVCVFLCSFFCVFFVVFVLVDVFLCGLFDAFAARFVCSFLPFPGALWEICFA